MRTLCLHPPSYDGFDGGAGSRYQARREIRSFWYPTWLAQLAALVPGSRLVDAPPAGLQLADILPLAAEYDMAVLHTSSPSFPGDVKVAEALKVANPRLLLGFVGAKVAVEPETSLAASPAVDFVAREEYDFTVAEIAEGRPLDQVDGITYRDDHGQMVRAPDRTILEDMDRLPYVSRSTSGTCGLRITSSATSNTPTFPSTPGGDAALSAPSACGRRRWVATVIALAASTTSWVRWRSSKIPCPR